jgi:hypothetical protein
MQKHFLPGGSLSADIISLNLKKVNTKPKKMITGFARDHFYFRV